MSGLSSFEPPAAPGAPLAERMRPSRLDDVVGQEHLVGPQGFLRQLPALRRMPSLILWGPPGSGKTTLARLIARETSAQFFALSAVTSGVKDVREVIEAAGRLRRAGKPTVLFIDEIHRFHRGQQDYLLPHVESGAITLIGATVEHPAHSVVAPLISRCRVLLLERLSDDQCAQLLRRALDDSERGLGGAELAASPEIIATIARESEGDARRALTTLDIAAGAARARTPAGPAALTLADVRLAAQRRLSFGDRQGDAHYDLASAFIKSLRGSDPDAAAYYLMRMIESGVDPLFSARRMVIFAAEDVGLADPRALGLAVAAAQAFERLGLPEGSLPLTEAALYLATAPKSNSVILARDAALRASRERGSLPIPAELRDSAAALSRALGHGRGYRHPHDEPGHHAPVDYLPVGLRGERFFEPGDQGEEPTIAERLRAWRAAVDLNRGRRGPTSP